jgi:type IV pilus assembly protein PilO
MNFLEDLKNLRNINPKNPGGWPWMAKLLACALILIVALIVGYLFDWQDQLGKLSSAKEEEIKLKEAFLVKKKQAINLDIIKKQLTETQQSFGALLKQLPNKSEMDALLTDINQAGLGRGLQFDLFRPSPEVVTGVFAEQSIALRVTGNYDDLGRFASDISQLPRIVTLNDIGVSPAGASLSMETTAKTYRYLDENELASQKKPAPAAGAKK